MVSILKDLLNEIFEDDREKCIKCKKRINGNIIIVERKRDSAKLSICEDCSKKINPFI